LPHRFFRSTQRVRDRKENDREQTEDHHKCTTHYDGRGNGAPLLCRADDAECERNDCRDDEEPNRSRLRQQRLRVWFRIFAMIVHVKVDEKSVARPLDGALTGGKNWRR